VPGITEHRKRRKKMERFRTKIALLALVVVALLSACTSGVVSPPLASGAPQSSVGQTDFTSAVAAVWPSVVEIEVTFGAQGAPGDPTAHAGAGTGWVVGANGLIATCNHVVDGAQTVNVIFNDGTKYTATAVRTYPSKDLAVVKIAAQNLTPLAIGNSSQVQLGQPLAVIGNALNLGIRVTVGVLSQNDVPANYDNISFTDLIEVDAAVNPGNSGGPIINLVGQVLGIVNIGLEVPNLDVESFNYGIPINEAAPILNQLISQLP